MMAADNVYRDDIIESCAAMLTASYPEHAWLNAVCASIRSMKSKPPIQIAAAAPVVDLIEEILGSPAKPAMPVCDACQREVESVRGSIWHGNSALCTECFCQWYDPDNETVDKVGLGNYVRSKHGLLPLQGDT